MTDTGLIRAAGDFTLASMFRRSAVLFRERPALVSADLELTYGEVDARTDRLAAALADAGLQRGDRLAVLSTTRPEYIELYLAAAKCGATVVGLNFRLHFDELVDCVRLTRPSAVFASPGYAEQAGRLASEAGAELFVRFGEGGEYDELVDRAVTARPLEAARADDIHSVIFTSGTTGRPKAALISQGAAAIRALRIAHWFGLTPEDGMVGWIPLFHTGVETVTSTLMTGGRWATLEQAEIPQMYELIERHRLTWTALLPGVFTEFIDHPDRTKHDLSSLRFAFGYGNMMPQVVKEFCSVFGAGYWDTYGQTESTFLVALDYVQPGEEPSLRKAPTPLLDLMIVDDQMQELPPGVPGECVVRGPTVMSGYLDNPAATAEAFRGGWLHTGDVLLRHDDGRLTFVDRVKYLIKTGGENVYPAEVEQVISQHESVREVCVISVADERWGEAIKAVVVTHPGHAVVGAEIREWCKSRLAGYKCPRYVEFMKAEDVPRSITGKILRNELEALSVTEDQRVG